VRLSLLGLVLAAAGALAGFLVLERVASQLGDVRELRANYRPAQVTRIYGKDDALLAELFVERRSIVSIKDVAPQVKLAVLAAEDAGFYEHQGLNYLGMLRALVVNLKAGRTRQGASTITQQVVKNILLDPERTYSRKLKEVVLARKLEQELSKDEILELYLNHIYWGGGRYGIEEAARYYFGKSARDVTVAEAALLAGLPAGPEHFSPRTNLQGALTRRAFVLDQMEKKGFLDAARAAEARQEPVRLATPAEAQGALAPEVVEIARRTLKDIVGDGYARGGYKVYTTVDPHLQALARKAVRDNLVALDKRVHAVAPFKAPVPPKKGKAPAGDKPFEGYPKASDQHRTLIGVVTGAHDETGILDVKVGEVEGSVKLADYERYNPKQLPPSAFAEEGARLPVTFLSPPPLEKSDKPPPRTPMRLELGAEGALVAVDVRTRDVLALVGSYEGVAGGLDRATQTKRQPGSTFKPILYSLAIHDRKATAASLYDVTTHPKGSPEDAGATQPIRLRDAIAKSVNAVAQKVIVDVGPAKVVEWAHKMGITAKLGPDLSLALGAYEIAPLEMAGAYTTLASGGLYEAPRLITRIVGPDGKDLPLPARAAPLRVMDETEAYVTTSLLTSVVDRGTGAKAREVGRPVAGKTGTTNQAKDAWFIGYSTDVVCAVWTGYDDPRPMGGGREAGATAALPAWVSFMKGAHDKKPIIDFARPPGIATVRIDPATGLRAYEGQTDSIDEIFLPGTEPADVAVPDAGAPDAAPEAPDAAVEPPAASVVKVPALPPEGVPVPSGRGLPQLPPLVGRARASVAPWRPSTSPTPRSSPMTSSCRGCPRGRSLGCTRRGSDGIRPCERRSLLPA
jgi:penicillin-binding protein 1A